MLLLSTNLSCYIIVLIAISQHVFSDFKLSPTTKDRMKAAQTKFNQLTSSLDFNPIEYYKMNRNYFKTHKLSPDSIMQLAIQVGRVFCKCKMTSFYYHSNYRLHFNDKMAIPPLPYESCSTSAFKHGRTETMRPATAATQDFVDKYHSSNKPSDQECRQLIERCSKIHSMLVKEASIGKV